MNLTAGTYPPLDAPHMRDAGAASPHQRARPLEWLRIILAHRDRLERVVRGLHGGNELCGYTTRQLMALGPDDCLERRAHRHLVEYYAAAHMWSDPVC